MRLLLLFVTTLIFMRLSVAAGDEPIYPLETRNTAPASLLFGIVAPASHRPGLSLSIDHGNMFSASSGDGVASVFDGETSVVRFAWQASVGDRWMVGAELPWVRHTGGVLDGFIEGYHDLFGFGEAGRDLVSRDRLVYRIVSGSDVPLDIRGSTSHVGDLRLHAGRSWSVAENSRINVRGLVKLPTGDADELSGSGAVDAGIQMDYLQSALFSVERLSMSVMAGGVHLGDGDLLRQFQRDFIPVGHLGFGIRLTDRIHFLMQADAHGAAFDIDSDIFGRTVLQGTLGGRIRLAKGFSLDVGVVEDLLSDSSPDVIFHMALRHSTSR